MPTPTQSLAHKAFKLKSTVSVVNKASQPRPRSRSRHRSGSCHRSSSHHRQPAWCPKRGAPYHLIGVSEIDGRRDIGSKRHLLLYMMDRFMWEHYGPKLDDLGNTFSSRTVFVTRFCMVAALYFEVAWTRGERWIFPLILDILTQTPMRHGGKLPEKPTCSTSCKGDNVRLRCREWWMYLLVLLQCWKDESCTFDYGSALRPDSTLMLFVYFRVKYVLKRAGMADFHLYQVRSKTQWNMAMLSQYTPDQLMAQREMHKEAKEEMTAFKDWMHRRYEAEATCEFNELQASGGNFDTLANRRVDPNWRPADKDQFCKERDMEMKRKGGSATPSGLDAECQRRRQNESEERRNYSRQRDEEIRFREGRTPSPITYDSGSPTTAASGTSTKKKITWAEYQSRPSPAEREQAAREKQEAEWREQMEAQQKELEYRRSEVDRLTREHDRLVAEQECLQAEQDEIMRCRATRRECRHCEYERAEQGRLAQQAQGTAQAQAQAQAPMGLHTPVQDEHGEALDYIHDVEQEQTNNEVWRNLWADNPLNEGLELLAQTRESETALLEGPTLAATPGEEETLLAAGPELANPVSELRCLPDNAPEGLSDNALEELSQQVNQMRWNTPSMASPAGSPRPPPGLETTPHSTEMAQALLQATSSLGQLPSGERPVTQAPDDEETRMATEILEAQMKVPGAPVQK